MHHSPPVFTMDFHVTSDCNQECPYCWGPQGFEQPVRTRRALQIVDRIKQVGARRIVFTGGDPLKRKDIGRLAEEYAETTRARVFYNIFQTFRRSMDPPDWDELLVSDEEFAAFERRLAPTARIRMNFLSREALDRLYAMVFPDGQLVLPQGPDYVSHGPFLEVDDLPALLRTGAFDAAKHLRHSNGWAKQDLPADAEPACLRRED